MQPQLLSPALTTNQGVPRRALTPTGLSSVISAPASTSLNANAARKYWKSSGRFSGRSSTLSELYLRQRSSRRFTLANKAVADAYGTTVENLIGKTDADFNRNRY